jgi:hypothetical protein
MISDAYVTVTCDREGCGSTLEAPLSVVYNDYSGKTPFADLREDALVKDMKRADHYWIEDEGKHFCSQECREAAGYGYEARKAREHIAKKVVRQ